MQHNGCQPVSRCLPPYCRHMGWQKHHRQSGAITGGCEHCPCCCPCPYSLCAGHHQALMHSSRCHLASQSQEDACHSSATTHRCMSTAQHVTHASAGREDPETGAVYVSCAQQQMQPRTAHLSKDAPDHAADGNHSHDFLVHSQPLRTPPPQGVQGLLTPHLEDCRLQHLLAGLQGTQGILKQCCPGCTVLAGTADARGCRQHCAAEAGRRPSYSSHNWVAVSCQSIT